MYTAQESRPHAQLVAPVATSAPATTMTSTDSGHVYPGYPGYESTTYQGYSYNYPQQGNPSHSQHSGGYENSAAPYQAINSYTDSTHYQGSNGYYNSGYPAAYQQSSYPSQWSGNNYANYVSYSGYQGYPQSDVTGTDQSLNTQYAQGYQQQWSNYYANLQNGSKPEDLDECTAPGTEPPVASASDTKSNSYGQPPPPGTQPGWNPHQTSYADMISTQASGPSENGGTFVSSGYMDHYSHVQPAHFQQQSYAHYNLQDQPLQFQPPKDQHSVIQAQHIQMPPAHIQGPSFQPKVFQSPVKELPQRSTPKLQIPTNPRIVPTVGMAAKVNTADSTALRKPAYVPVAGKIPVRALSDASKDSMPQSGAFPPSLHAYVVRALSRCKDELQKKACQEIMKEIITKASSDGSLFTRDWDTEPLFPLPVTTAAISEKEIMQLSSVTNIFPKQDRSPTRRSKSRWEPVTEAKLDEKADIKLSTVTKDGTWNTGVGESSVSSLKWERQDGVWNKSRAMLHQQFTAMNNIQRATKKARKDDSGNVIEGNNSSEDSEMETTGGVCLGTLSTEETSEEKLRRQSRTKRFDKGKDIKSVNRNVLVGKSGIGASASARRATVLLLARNIVDGIGGAVEDINWDALTVKGTCQEVEKRYLRLTSAPDPTTVRPEDILKKALVLVQTTQKNYLYKCEQLKSIRQDLTVQRIRNELTVQVYETHARMALEAGDLPEYNQCQSQLKGLYAEGIEGCNKEFMAYSLLYIIFHRGNNQDLLTSMARFSMDDKEDKAIKHALAVRSAVAAGNYTSFFRLYRMAPNLGTCLMDLHVEKMRFEALKCMTRAYRPTLCISYIGRILGFIGFEPSETAGGKNQDELDECEEWLRAHGAVLVNDTDGELCVECKASSASLFMPEPEDAVAHGDANLAVNDFFTQV